MTEKQFLKSDILPGPPPPRKGNPTVLRFREESRLMGHGTFLHFDSDAPFLGGYCIRGSANADRTLQDGDGRGVAFHRGRGLYVPNHPLTPGQEASKKTVNSTSDPLYKWGEILNVYSAFDMGNEDTEMSLWDARLKKYVKAYTTVRRGKLLTTGFEVFNKDGAEVMRFMFEEKAMSWRNAWGCCDFTDEVYIITIQEGIDIGFALAFFMAWKVTNQYRK